MTNFFLQSPNKKMVFIATLKNWSTTFRQLLTSVGWQEVEYDQIDFDQHLVFGVLTHPHKRYLKGVVEDMMRTGIQDRLLETELIWETPPILGLHSIPLSVILDDMYEKTNWIPLDAPDVNGEQRVIELIKQHTGEDFGPSLPQANASDRKQKQIFKQVEQFFTDASRHWFDTLYPKECKIYYQCIDKARNA